VGILVDFYLKKFTRNFNLIPRNQFFSATGLDLAIHKNLASLNQLLGLSASANHAA
jgi:hypothetical protein